MSDAICLMRRTYSEDTKACVCSEEYAGNYCHECAARYLPNSNKSICSMGCLLKDVHNNCLVCDNTQCTLCEEGFAIYLGQCLPNECGSNCSVCTMLMESANSRSVEMSLCVECQENYHLLDGLCIFEACAVNCKKCD